MIVLHNIGDQSAGVGGFECLSVIHDETEGTPGRDAQMQPVSGNRQLAQRLTLLPRAAKGLRVFKSSRARRAMMELRCSVAGKVRVS